MPKRVLDTSKLISHWKRLKPLKGKTPEDAEKWARQLIEIEKTDAILTPIQLEMLGGDLNGSDRDFTRAYLEPFRIIDEGRILEQDWIEARRLIERIPRPPIPRGLVDCLIRAIADRLKHEVVTLDKGMPRTSG